MPFRPVLLCCAFVSVSHFLGILVEGLGFDIWNMSYIFDTHTHGPFSGTTRNRTSLQTDNRTSTPPLRFYRPDALPAAQPTVSEH